MIIEIPASLIALLVSVSVWELVWKGIVECGRQGDRISQFGLLLC